MLFRQRLSELSVIISTIFNLMWWNLRFSALSFIFFSISLHSIQRCFNRRSLASKKKRQGWWNYVVFHDDIGKMNSNYWQYLQCIAHVLLAWSNRYTHTNTSTHHRPHANEQSGWIARNPSTTGSIAVVVDFSLVLFFCSFVLSVKPFVFLLFI